MNRAMQKTLACVAAAVAALALSAPASAANRVVTIVNKTKTPIVEFYASKVNVKNWEEDILGVDVLMPRESVDIDFDDGVKGCRYDFKAVFKDGDEVEQGNVNVCELSTFEFTE